MQRAGANLHCGAWASHCGDFFYCRAQALGSWASVVVVHGLSCSVAGGIFSDPEVELMAMKQGKRDGRGYFPGGASVVEDPPANAGGTGNSGSIPGSERTPGGGNGNLFQYSCLENPMDRGTWWATVHNITKGWTQLK